jgi:hypothetical protein
LDAPEIILNEIHADPDLAAGDANNDGQVDSDDDEFLEFVNTGVDEIDLSGWSITDGARTRFTFPEGSVLEGCRAVVIFGGGLPVGEFGTSLVYTAGSLGLNNSGDTITLWDHNGEKKLWYSYGEEGGENQSLTRSPDIIGEPPLVLHSEAALTLGEIFSPGVKQDGSAFTNCP